MKNLGCAAIAMLLIAGTIAPAGAADGLPRRARTALLRPGVILFAGDHLVPQNAPNAGMIAQATGLLPGLGKVLLTGSASWDWSTYSSDHKCALLNTTPKTLVADLIPGAGTFTANATIAFTKFVRGQPDFGSQLTADIVGGSVCEVGTCQGAGAIDEALLSFRIQGPGTGIFSGVTGGEGTVRIVMDTCSGEFLVTEAMVRIER